MYSWMDIFMDIFLYAYNNYDYSNMIMIMMADNHCLISGDVVEFDFQKKVFKFGSLASLLTPLEVHSAYICLIINK
jgi:hypothetical protein